MSNKDKADVLQGTLDLMVLQTVASLGPLHGYAIAQRIRALSSEQLSVEEGSLYPALQKALANGWLKAEWKTTETGRDAIVERLRAEDREHLVGRLA